MDDLQGDRQALTEALDRFGRKADALMSAGNSSISKIEVNAGGIGVWVAATCCLIMLASLGLVSIIGAVLIQGGFDKQAQEMQELRDKDEIHDAWIQTINNRKQDKTQ